MIRSVARFLQKEPTMLGPISLLITLAIAVKTSIPFDLLFIACAGLILSVHWQIRGCCYAIALLSIAAIFRHSFGCEDHLWQLGIEGSMALGFFIIALASEQGTALIESLSSQIETRAATLENLEEEIAKLQEISQAHQIAFQEKVASLQKELEELQTEHASILILNEVLRKTTARETAELQTLLSQNFELSRKVDTLKTEYEACEDELIRLRNTDTVVIQNKQLMKELNAARYEKEQTHLINETLARLYARESLKAKDSESEAASLKEQLRAAVLEIERIGPPLEAKLAASEREIVSLRGEFEKTNIEANRVRAELQRLSAIQSERNFLKERLEAAMEEIAHLQQRTVQVQPDPKIAEELIFAQQRIHELSQVEPLYKQLKKQFEEKNQVLHQVRSSLFKADTELQALRMEKASMESSPLPKEIEREIEQLGVQLIALEEENIQLQELITILSDNSTDAAKRKKKVKTLSSLEQDFLF